MASSRGSIAPSSCRRAAKHSRSETHDRSMTTARVTPGMTCVCRASRTAASRLKMAKVWKLKAQRYAGGWQQREAMATMKGM